MTYSDDAMDVQFYRHATLSMFEIRKCFNWRMHFYLSENEKHFTT